MMDAEQVQVLTAKAREVARDVSSEMYAENGGKHVDVRPLEPLVMLTVGEARWFLVRITSYFPTAVSETWWATNDVEHNRYGASATSVAETPADVWEQMGVIPR